VVIKYLGPLFLLLFISLDVSAKVTATIDRTTIEFGETFQLTVQTDGDEPELEVLEQQFDVLGTSTNTSVSIVNGAMNRVNKWLVTLAPKQIGKFIVPGIRAGNSKSAPIQVDVIKPVVQQGSAGRDIFLEAKVDTPSTYVQSQIVYTVRLYRAVEIRDASLTEPNLDDVVLERFGEDITFQTRRSGRLYQVTERKFAIFPQKSGALNIPPVIFQGQVPDTRQAQQHQTNDPFNRFFQTQRMKRVRIQSEAVEVEVKAAPTNISAKHWLPAKDFKLTEAWSPDPPVFKVGEPITRTLTMEATGLTGAQLPELKLHNSNGIKQYNDQPVVDTKWANNSLNGVRVEKFAIVPTDSGKLVLPEIRLYWWDTEFERERLVSISPKIIQVAAVDITMQQPQVQQTASAISEQSVNNVTDTAKEVVKIVVDAGQWPLIALALGLGWLATIITVVILWKRQKNVIPGVSTSSGYSVDQTSLTQAKNQLKAACSKNDPAAANRALLAWAAAMWPEDPPRSLSIVSQKMSDSTLKKQFKELRDVLYSHKEKSWDGNRFWDEVSVRLKKTRENKKKKVESLPDLYPNHS